MKSLTLLPILLTTALALPHPHRPAPVRRQVSIPPPPADPPQPAGDGAGPYDSEDPSLGDRAHYYEYRSMATAASALGWSHAAENLNHYLDNVGTDLYEDPLVMMHDLPDFDG